MPRTYKTNCPICDDYTAHDATEARGVHRCRKCGALQGRCYKGDLSAVVLPFWDENPNMDDGVVYYDIDVLGSQGLERQHGWVRASTRKIVQIG